MEEIAAQQEDGAPGKKKRKKRKKKAKGAGEDAEAESEGPAIYQGPPKIEVIKMLYFHSNQKQKQFISIFKFLIYQIIRLSDYLDYWMENHFCWVFLMSCQDEEEFPGLTLALTVNDRLITSSNPAKLCNEVHTISCFSSQIRSHNHF